MFEGECAVVEAVRDILRRKMNLEANQCDCEPDEQIPAIAGSYYLAVIPNGISPGPVQNTSGGVHDVVHSVQVMVIQRKMEARDKSRNHFVNSLLGINKLVSQVIQAIDWQDDIRSLANAYLFRDYPNAMPFHKTLNFSRVDQKPKPIASQLYGGVQAGGPGTTPYIGYGRSVYFSGMRRTQTVIQLTPTDVV